MKEIGETRFVKFGNETVAIDKNTTYEDFLLDYLIALLTETWIVANISQTNHPMIRLIIHYEEHPQQNHPLLKLIEQIIAVHLNGNWNDKILIGLRDVSSSWPTMFLLHVISRFDEISFIDDYYVYKGIVLKISPAPLNKDFLKPMEKEWIDKPSILITGKRESSFSAADVEIDSFPDITQIFEGEELERILFQNILYCPTKGKAEVIKGKDFNLLPSLNQPVSVKDKLGF